MKQKEVHIIYQKSNSYGTFLTRLTEIIYYNNMTNRLGEICLIYKRCVLVVILTIF